MYIHSFSLLATLEAYLLGEGLSDNRFLRFLQRTVWFPCKFLKMGVEEKSKGAISWSLGAFALLVAGTLLLNSSEVPSHVKADMASLLIWFSAIPPAFLVLFALPSSYAHSGVSAEDVRFVCALLARQGIRNEKEVEILKKSVKAFEDRSRSRITAFKWLSGLLWGAFVYHFTKSMDASVDIQANAITAALLLLAVLAAYLLVWGYEASLDKLFKTIEFGCNDFCYALQSTA